ncbi:predicted protein [Sclerotinia sclerotiorum 1980 UF-70]|uniref:Uncharacterized protein n=1 Tax=Sclerotinia sclerotiorum (strain ATCC 18683 / 1980 / Ss-1) TaxID=665079 RepID=A7EP85_SCLS1|nr:predicted protein [Sclerotinia sclerotiorum 1980 UF-70]EDO04651.1 predicted protein [Sclerotinia sclerotiorum 1980 UF-70]
MLAGFLSRIYFIKWIVSIKIFSRGSCRGTAILWVTEEVAFDTLISMRLIIFPPVKRRNAGNIIMHPLRNLQNAQNPWH